MKQRGFNLVEMAIVLVIIGLLLGGILSSRSIVSSVQAKNVVSLVEDLRTATTYFKQRYNYLPGDWEYSAGAISGVISSPGNGDGKLDGAVDALTGAASTVTEVSELPVQLYNAGFIGKLSPDTTRRISTTFGGVHIVSAATANGLVPGFSVANPAVRNAIVFFNLPCEIVNEVDNSLDDGISTSGRAMSSIGLCPEGSISPWFAIAL